MQVASVERLPAPARRISPASLLVVSDMIQNSGNLSFFREPPEFGELVPQPGLRDAAGWTSPVSRCPCFSWRAEEEAGRIQGGTLRGVLGGLLPGSGSFSASHGPGGSWWKDEADVSSPPLRLTIRRIATGVPRRVDDRARHRLRDHPLRNLIEIGPWWVALGVAAWMVAYGYFIERTVDEADVPSDTKGESIYYLGLLFTFAAMIAALITFDWGAPVSDGRGTAGAFRNFGIALLTTIVGLAGRVWFTMSQESPGDIADTTRSRLEETVSLMKQSLDRARDDLDIMAHKFRDSSAGLGELAEIIAEGTRNTAGIIAEGTQQTAGIIAEGKRRTADAYDALDAYSVQISGAARSLAREMDRMNAVCDASTAVLAALQDRADGIGQRFEAMQTRLVETENTLDGINRVAAPAAERVGATLQSVQETESAVSALRETLSGVRGSAERAKEALAGIADAVDRHEVLARWDEAVEQLHAGTPGDPWNRRARRRHERRIRSPAGVREGRRGRARIGPRRGQGDQRTAGRGGPGTDRQHRAGPGAGPYPERRPAGGRKTVRRTLRRARGRHAPCAEAVGGHGDGRRCGGRG